MTLNWTTGHGFGVDDGASLLMAFRGLQTESVVQGEVHRGIARDLEDLVLDPFIDWSAKHKDRIYDSRTVILDEWVKGYENGQSEVSTRDIEKNCQISHFVLLPLGFTPS
jgi:hypothetical protein